MYHIIRKCTILFITQALVLCLIYMHVPSGVMHIYQSILACVITYTYIYIYIYYGDVIHQRRQWVYIYTYTPAHGLICIIYTSYVLCSPEERFNSTNNESISSDRYRRTKFSAKMIFHIVHQCSPQYLYPN